MAEFGEEALMRPVRELRKESYGFTGARQCLRDESRRNMTGGRGFSHEAEGLPWHAPSESGLNPKEVKELEPFPGLWLFGEVGLIPWFSHAMSCHATVPISQVPSPQDAPAVTARLSGVQEREGVQYLGQQTVFVERWIGFLMQSLHRRLTRTSI